MRRLPLLVAAVALLSARLIAAEPMIPSREAVLSGLRTEHPRLLATQAEFDKVQRYCRDGGRARQWLVRLTARAEDLLAAPPVEYEIPDGKRLLAVSRAAKDRVLVLGLVYRLSGDVRFANRLWKELDTVTNFKNWNPSHFLDTAEMTFAVAVGYDWLYDHWTPSQRQQLQEAIVRLGLHQALPVYRKESWWSRANHNWNQVCNGGLIVGALAIGDVEPELAGEVLHAALRSLPLAMHEFGPDGGWGEGPGYWNYATEYNVYLLAALDTALGTDFSLSHTPGFAQTGDFPLYCVGPTGKSFNFADAHDGWRGAPQWFWLAREFGQPAYAAAQLPFADARTAPLDLLWGAPWTTQELPQTDLPLARRFDGVSVAALRGQWNDPQAWFVAIKGGDNRVNHGHLDLGTFVLDALGQRWALDLGPDDYNLPGYFGKERWSYFRNNTHSHNTLVIDGQNQSPAAHAKIVRFAAGDEWSGAVVDLSAAWPQVQRAWRGAALIDRQAVLVQDEVAADKPVAPVWQMLTEARIETEGSSATLSAGGQQITATLLAPPEARWEVAEVSVARPERPITNVRKLTATVPQPTTELRYAIVFQPAAGSVRVPELVPLDKWPNRSP